MAGAYGQTSWAAKRQPLLKQKKMQMPGASTGAYAPKAPLPARQQAGGVNAGSLNKAKPALLPKQQQPGGLYTPQQTRKPTLLPPKQKYPQLPGQRDDTMSPPDPSYNRPRTLLAVGQDRKGEAAPVNPRADDFEWRRDHHPNQVRYNYPDRGMGPRDWTVWKPGDPTGSMALDIGQGVPAGNTGQLYIDLPAGDGGGSNPVNPNRGINPGGMYTPGAHEQQPKNPGMVDSPYSSWYEAALSVNNPEEYQRRLDAGQTPANRNLPGYVDPGNATGGKVKTTPSRPSLAPVGNGEPIDTTVDPGDPFTTTRTKNDIQGMMDRLWGNIDNFQPVTVDRTGSNGTLGNISDMMNDSTLIDQARQSVEGVDPNALNGALDRLRGLNISDDYSLGLNVGNTSYDEVLGGFRNKSDYLNGKLQLDDVDIADRLAQGAGLQEQAAAAGQNLGDLSVAGGDISQMTPEQIAAAGGREMIEMRNRLGGNVMDTATADPTRNANVTGINESMMRALTGIMDQGMDGISSDLHQQLYEATMRPYEQARERELERLKESAQQRGVFHSDYLSMDERQLAENLLNQGKDVSANLALESTRLGQERMFNALDDAQGFSTLAGEQERALGSEAINRAGLGSEFLNARETARLGAEGENTSREGLRLEGTKTAGDLWNQATGYDLTAQQQNIQNAVNEDKALAEREQLNQSRLAGLNQALTSQDESQRARAQIELNRINSENAEIGRRRDQIMAQANNEAGIVGQQEGLKLSKAAGLTGVSAAETGRANVLGQVAGLQQGAELTDATMQANERNRLDNMIRDTLGSEQDYNFKEQDMISREYSQEWQRQFQAMATEFDMNRALEADDLNAVNAYLQQLWPGISPARAGDNLLDITQSATKQFGAREMVPTSIMNS